MVRIMKHKTTPLPNLMSEFDLGKLMDLVAVLDDKSRYK